MMDDKEEKPSAPKVLSLGPEAATRNFVVSFGRKILNDIVLGFSALTIIGVLQILQSYRESIVLQAFETITTATLTGWILFLVAMPIPHRIYERIITIKRFSIQNILVTLITLIFIIGIMAIVTNFVSQTVASLNLLASK